MANTYTLLSVTLGAHRYVCRHKKPHKGDVVDQKIPYTLHAAQKYVWVVCDVFKSRIHNFDGAPTTLQTENRTRPQAKFHTMSVPQLRGDGGCPPTHALKLYLV